MVIKMTLVLNIHIVSFLVSRFYGWESLWMHKVDKVSAKFTNVNQLKKSWNYSYPLYSFLWSLVWRSCHAFRLHFCLAPLARTQGLNMTFSNGYTTDNNSIKCHVKVYTSQISEVTWHLIVLNENVPTSNVISARNVLNQSQRKRLTSFFSTSGGAWTFSPHK